MSSNSNIPSNNNYRDLDNSLDLTGRVNKLEESVKDFTNEWKANLWEGWRYLGYVLSTLAVLVACAFSLGRSCAFGANARANAEREAVRYTSTNYPMQTQFHAYCHEASGAPTGEVACDVTSRTTEGQLVSLALVCDDDPASSNDGCHFHITDNDGNATQNGTQGSKPTPVTQQQTPVVVAAPPSPSAALANSSSTNQ